MIDKSDKTITLELTPTELKVIHYIVCNFNFSKLTEAQDDKGQYQFDEDVCDHADMINHKTYQAYRKLRQP